MSGLSINSKTIDKYFHYLKKLDNRSKKRLIDKRKASINVDEPNKNDAELFGAWEDLRNSDEILKEIRSSRVESQDPEQF